MKIYIAAPWTHMNDARDVRDQLVTYGYEVTSRWIDVALSGESNSEHETCKREAEHDIYDLDSADAMLYLNLAKSEGKATELGMAMAWEIPVIVIGGRQNNVFLHTDHVQHVDDLEAALVKLKELA